MSQTPDRPSPIRTFVNLALFSVIMGGVVSGLYETTKNIEVAFLIPSAILILGTLGLEARSRIRRSRQRSRRGQ